MPAKPLIEVTELTVRRNGVTLLQDLNWSVEAGEHWFILGPNGSGKTTLLNVLLGNLAPTAGAVSLLGKTYGRYNWEHMRKRVGLVSNSLGRRVEAHQLAEEVLLSGLRGMVNFWGRVQARERRLVEDMMERVGASHLDGRPWRVLSQGERQRLLIGRALIANPDLLFLDEPCAGLDPVAREAFLGFLQPLLGHPEGPAVVLVTHHVEEILPRFKRGLLLKDGQPVALGSAAGVLTPPLLRQTFGPHIRIRKAGRRWEMQVRVNEVGLF
jgi:iron complex transport system ATP-binding protein